MITLKNPLAANEWIIDLKEYPQVENSLPMTGLNVRNDSNIVACVDLDGLKVGEVQRYGADPFQGRAFSLIRIYNPDGQDFAANDLFIQVLKGEVMGSQPFNPQWDMMFDDLDRFATGTDSRISISDTIDFAAFKYWINTQNSVIVQRRLDIQAHATLLGEYRIIFNADNVLSGAVGIGTPPPSDTLLHRYTLTESTLDYTLTNTSIVGWVMDYLKNPSDRTIGATITDDPGNGAKAFDNDMSTMCDENSTAGSNNWVVIMELDLLTAYDITEAHMLCFGRVADHTGYVKLEGWTGGAWEELVTVEIVDTPNYTTGNHEVSLTKNISKARVSIRNPTAGFNVLSSIIDISIF